MKTIVISIAILLTSSVVWSQHTLTVHMSNFKTNSGTVYVKLLNINQETIQKEKVSVYELKTKVIFTNIPTGKYAIQYYHDENENDKLDTGMFGKPIEGYGYSNDARGMFGPADFEDQVIEINGDKVISLVTAN